MGHASTHAMSAPVKKRTKKLFSFDARGFSVYRSCSDLTFVDLVSIFDLKDLHRPLAPADLAYRNPRRASGECRHC